MALILIIEDNAANLELMAYLLQAGGHTTLHAPDGEQGLALAGKERPDLVLCDIRLPGMDGYQVVGALKASAALRSIPVVAVTASAMMGDMEKGISAGFDGYIEKPIIPETLVNQVNSWLKEAPEAPSVPPLPAPVREPETPPAAVAADKATPTILVVDDRAVNRQFLSGLLGFSGYRPLEARDGADGLAMARQHHPDLIISDIMMPVMDGAALANAVHADPALSGIPILFYTATYRVREAKEIARACNVRWILPKPSDPQTILTVVAEALGREAPAARREKEPSPEEMSLPAQKPSEAIAERLADYLDTLSQFNLQMQGVIRKGLDLAAESAGLRELSEHLDESLSNLQSLGLRMAAVVELGMELSSEHDPQVLVSLFGRGAQDVLNVHYAAVGLSANDDGQIEHLATRGLDSDTAAGLRDKGAAIQAALAGRPLIRLDDLTTGAPGVQLPRSHPAITNFLAVPVTASGKELGWMYVANRLGDSSFTEDDERLALTLAALLGTAYENVILQSEANLRATQLEAEVQERISAQIALRDLARRLLSAQEEERRRLAAELHDGVQQLLTAAKLQLSVADRYARGRSQEGIQKAEAILTEAMDESRRIMTGLRPHLLDQLGLTDALRYHLASVAEHAHTVATLDVQGDTRGIDPAVVTALFRITQEAVENAISHGHAQHIIVHLRIEEDVAFLQVQDDGTGFDVAKLSHEDRPHLGLDTMRERAELLGGLLNIESAPGKGTIAAAEVPLNTELASSMRSIYE